MMEEVMASSIVPPCALVSNAIISDLIWEVDDDLEFQPRAFAQVFQALSAAVNAVAVACRDAGPVDQVIAVQRTRAMVAGPTCEKAFGLFVEHMLSASAA
jgi:hypothetical protein